MLYEWLNRSHIVEWWGGEEARPTLADVQEQYLPSVLAQESVTPYIAMLNGEPIRYASRTLLLEAGTDGGKKKPIQVRGIDQSLANASQLGKGLGTKLVRALVELLFNDPRSPRSKRTRRRATCERSDATKAGFGRYRNHPRWSSRVHGSNTPGIRANAVMPNPSIEGTSKGWRPWPPSCQTLDRYDSRPRRSI